MAKLDLIAIGASAGGLDALIEIVAHLPERLPVTILIVVHKRSGGENLLPQILSRHSKLPVTTAEHGKPARPGHIYVAPTDLHLLVTRRGFVLTRGPRENSFRPAIDPLFRSVARACGRRAMGVILSGALDDGAYGLKVLKAAGGLAVVQDPNEARFPSMPLSAITAVAVDHVLPASRIADLIVERAGKPPDQQGEDAMARTTESEPQNRGADTDVEEMESEFGPPSGFTCPACGGALWEIGDAKLVRYRCHVGHQYTQDGLDAEQHMAVEGALWTAVRVLEEHATMRRKMAQRTATAGMGVLSSTFAQSADESEQQAHTIRQLLLGASPSRAEAAPVPAPAKKRARTGRAAPKAAVRPRRKAS